MTDDTISIQELLKFMKNESIDRVLHLVKSIDPEHIQVGAEQTIPDTKMFVTREITGQPHNPVRSHSSPGWTTRSDLGFDEQFDTRKNDVTLFTSFHMPDVFNGQYELQDRVQHLAMHMQPAPRQPQDHDDDEYSLREC